MTARADAIRALGGAALGARLRRLSEQIDRDAARIYRAKGIAFEQRWFGLLRELAGRGPMAIGDIADALGITHVSVSQSSRSLESAGLVVSHPDARDGRRRRLDLSPAGHDFVTECTPLWRAFDRTAEELDREAGRVVQSLDRLDDALARKPLFDRIMEQETPLLNRAEPKHAARRKGGRT